MDVYVCLCTSVLVCVRLYVWTVTVANESVNKGDNYQLAEDWILLTNVPAFQSSLLVMLRDSCYCVCMYVCVCARMSELLATLVESAGTWTSVIYQPKFIVGLDLYGATKITHAHICARQASYFIWPDVLKGIKPVGIGTKAHTHKKFFFTMTVSRWKQIITLGRLSFTTDWCPKCCVE